MKVCVCKCVCMSKSHLKIFLIDFLLDKTFGNCVKSEIATFFFFYYNSWKLSVTLVHDGNDFPGAWWEWFSWCMMGMIFLVHDGDDYLNEKWECSSMWSMWMKIHTHIFSKPIDDWKINKWRNMRIHMISNQNLQLKINPFIPREASSLISFLIFSRNILKNIRQW